MTQEPKNNPEQKVKPKSMELGLGGARNEAIAGFVFLVLIFGGCVYNVGKPWNCEQAQAAVEQAQERYDSHLSSAMEDGKVDKNTGGRLSARQSDVDDARAVARRKCN